MDAGASVSATILGKTFPSWNKRNNLCHELKRDTISAFKVASKINQ